MAHKSARKPLIPGLSRREIGELLGVSWRTVEAWEQSGKIPKWTEKAIKNLKLKGDK